jgi:predicted kinase
MDERAQKYLSNGESVIYDATNLWAKSRQNLLAELPEGVTKECVWLKTPLELAILHDGDRDAPTPRGIIQMQAMMLQPPSYKEGWDYIRIVGT